MSSLNFFQSAETVAAAFSTLRNELVRTDHLLKKMNNFTQRRESFEELSNALLDTIEVVDEARDLKATTDLTENTPPGFGL